MISQKLHLKIRELIKPLQGFANRFWYAPLIGLLSGLDNLIVVIPNDGILISSSMLAPKRWLLFAVSMAIGSTIGALSLALLVRLYGLPWIIEIYPGITESQTWALAIEFFESYGLALVFFMSLTPFPQQPAVILASLAHSSFLELGVVICVSRLLKFLILAYIGSHTPRLLTKMWGLKSELQDVGVKLE